MVFGVGNKCIMPVLGWSPWVELPAPHKRSLHHRCRDGQRSSLEPLVSTTLRDLLGTWVVGFNLGEEVALIEAIRALYGTKKITRI